MFRFGFCGYIEDIYVVVFVFVCWVVIIVVCDVCVYMFSIEKKNGLFEGYFYCYLWYLCLVN